MRTLTVGWPRCRCAAAAWKLPRRAIQWNASICAASVSYIENINPKRQNNSIFVRLQEAYHYPTMSDKRDPIAFELFKNAIFSIADEMALTVVRTTYSGVLKDNMDFSTAFCRRRRQAGGAGTDAARATSGSIPTALAAVHARGSATTWGPATSSS